MLIEVRKLVFTDDLLQQALLDHCEAEGVDVPNSQIQKVRFIGKPGKAASVVVEFVTADPDRPFERHLNEDFVLAAMIRACKDNRVPLPRDATKKLQVTDQGLAMTVSMKVNTTAPPPPMQRAAS